MTVSRSIHISANGTISLHFIYIFQWTPLALDCKEIQPVHSKGDQSWVFFGRTDAKAETPILWLPYAKSWLIGKDSDAGRDWGQEKKRMTEDEMAGWHHRLDRHEFEWIPGVGDGQGGLECRSSWGRKELDTTERLNWTESKDLLLFGQEWMVRGWYTIGSQSLGNETMIIICYVSAMYKVFC